MKIQLGEAESVSQTEYDVTAYRNVLDQLQTILGEVNRVRNVLRGDLATTVGVSGGRNTDPKKLNGFMMQTAGGKHYRRWTVVVSKAIDLNVRNYKRERYNAEQTKKWAENVAKSGSIGYRRVPARGKGSRGETVQNGPERLPFKGRVSNYVFDIHNLIRNVNWELNRLRIEMPFDLRQFTNQLNEWALRIRTDDWEDAAIVEWKIFNKVEELRKTIIPKMQERLRKKIKEAELSKKVAEDTIRKENEKTITKEEREKRESEKKKTGTKQDNSTSAINLGPVSSGGGTVTVTASESAKAKELEDAVERLKKENAEMLAENGEGKGGAGLVAGGLALLLLMGQG